MSLDVGANEQYIHSVASMYLSLRIRCLAFRQNCSLLLIKKLLHFSVCLIVFIPEHNHNLCCILVLSVPHFNRLDPIHRLGGRWHSPCGCGRQRRCGVWPACGGQRRGRAHQRHAGRAHAAGGTGCADRDTGAAGLQGASPEHVPGYVVTRCRHRRGSD